MGKLLEKAVAEAKKLPEQEQEAFAAWALAAAEAKRDYRSGRTDPLDPKKL